MERRSQRIENEIKKSIARGREGRGEREREYVYSFML